MGYSPTEQSWILNAFPAAAIIGLFFSNQFADRNFAAEKFLSFSHLVGRLSMFGLTMTTGFWPFLILMWMHCLFYVATISITNSIAFAHMKDPVSEFGPKRMGGTIGWILAAWPFAFILVDRAAVRAAEPEGLIELIGTVLGSGLTGDAMRAATPWTFRVAGIACMALAAYSLFLPLSLSIAITDSVYDGWRHGLQIDVHDSDDDIDTCRIAARIRIPTTDGGDWR